MARNFSTFIYYNQQKLSTVFVPVSKSDGLHYEVNVQNYPRFFMAWSELGRYDLVNHDDTPEGEIPYEIILAASEKLDKLKR